MSIVTLTDKAKAKINELCAEKNAFAVSLNLKGGGCAGFEYDWGFVEESEPGDELINTGTGNLVIGKQSIMFWSNFEIRNPNAKSSCGCGVSVNFDFDKLKVPA